MNRVTKAIVVVLLVVAILVSVIYIYLDWLSKQVPADKPTRSESTRPSDIEPVPSRPLGVFRLPWNAREKADWPVARNLAEISDEAYLSGEAARIAFSRRGFSTVDSVVKNSMVCYVASVDDVTVVAFRGTDFKEWDDWTVNRQFPTIPQLHGRVHQGFANAYATLADDVLKHVRSRKPKYLWITGHSLGGALALMCAYDLETKQNLNIAGLMTYGQPRIGDKAFSDFMDDKLNGRYVYFVNHDDVVPRLPQWLYHSGSLVWFKDKDILRTNIITKVYGATSLKGQEKQIEELPPLTDAELEQLNQQLRQSKSVQRTERTERGETIVQDFPVFIKDHLMQYYIEQILSFVKKLGTPAPPASAKRHSYELQESDRSLRIQAKRGEILEIKLYITSFQFKPGDVTITCPPGITHLGSTTQSMKTDKERTIMGARWYCVFFKVEQSGQVKMDHKSILKTHEHILDIDLGSD